MMLRYGKAQCLSFRRWDPRQFYGNSLYVCRVFLLQKQEIGASDIHVGF